MGETRKMRDTAAEWCGRERREDGVDTRQCMGEEEKAAKRK
jgi:hypothetical protein